VIREERGGDGIPSRKEPLFNKVRKNIKPVRKQGEPPEEDLENMEGFICDLCLKSTGRAEIIQCPFCGRWVCRTGCYSDDELSCVSCAGVIRLMRESVVLGDLTEPEKPEKKKNKKQ
jgi:hypothetical protein